MFTFDKARVTGDPDRWQMHPVAVGEDRTDNEWANSVRLTGVKNGSNNPEWSNDSDDHLDRLTKITGDAADPEKNGMAWRDRTAVNDETGVQIHDGTIDRALGDWQVITGLTRVYLGEDENGTPVHIGCIIKAEDRAYGGDVRWSGFRLCPDGAYRQWVTGSSRQGVAQRMTYFDAPRWSDLGTLEIDEVWDVCQGGTVARGDEQRQQELATAVVCEGVVIFGVKERNV